MGRTFIKAVLNSARAIHPNDNGPAAQNARRINGLLISMASVPGQGRLEKDQNSQDKCVIKSAVTPDHKDYAVFDGRGQPAGPGSQCPNAYAQAADARRFRVVRAGRSKGASVMMLRPRQSLLVDRTLSALDAYGNTLAVAPTGSAKPSCCRRWPAGVSRARCQSVHPGAPNRVDRPKPRQIRTRESGHEHVRVRCQRKVLVWPGDVCHGADLVTAVSP